jgi:hypothetical protein
MTLYYSPNSKAFYDDGIPAKIPDDAVQISSAEHGVLLDAVNSGGSINMVDGRPVAVAYVQPEPTLEQIRAAMPTLSPRQFWLAASRIDITKDAVLAQVDAMEDKAASADMRIEVTETVSFQRTNPAVDELATLLGITAEQLDSLWVWAAEF